MIAQLGGSKDSLSEAESKAVLQSIGVPVTKDVIVNGMDATLFDRMTPPLVVKIVSQDIPHKTEIGGVKVGIKSREELDAAICEVLDNARKHRPDARIDGVLVTEMVRGGFEAEGLRSTVGREVHPTKRTTVKRESACSPHP